MALSWDRKRILIWGKTRPELSKSYREIVCTGGVFEDTGALVRLYPIPLRYVDDEKVFRKYQWIEAEVAKSPSDPRPESYKIRYDGIHTLHTIPPGRGNWDERAKWVLVPRNIFASVEHLLRKREEDGTSLGLVKPKAVLSVKARKFSAAERDGFWKHYRDALSQMELPLDELTGRPIRPLSPPDYRFVVEFQCDDTACLNSHSFSVLDWEVDALYFHLRERGDSAEEAATKVVKKIRDQICAPDKDLYFFLGNISTHPQIFSVVGFFWPKKK